MTFFLATCVFAYLLDAVLVGFAVSAPLLRRRRVPSPRALLVLLIAVFAVLDTYFLPAIHALDLHITVGNAEVARYLETSDGSLPDIIADIGLLDVGIWVVQALVASAIVARLLRAPTPSAA
ncbi:MAG: hypothetical protein ACYTG2_10525 [Planctomycetota bacterium]|jgi:hypothetical protein